MRCLYYYVATAASSSLLFGLRGGGAQLVGDGVDRQGDFTQLRRRSLEGAGRVFLVGRSGGDLHHKLVVLGRALRARDLELRSRLRLDEPEHGRHAIVVVVGGLDLQKGGIRSKTLSKTDLEDQALLAGVGEGVHRDAASSRHRGFSRFDVDRHS